MKTAARTATPNRPPASRSVLFAPAATGRYLVVDPPHRLVFTWQSGASTGGRESQVTVTLRGKGATTEMTILHERLPAAEYRDGARRAWTAIAARLPAYLTGRRDS